jgi:hypothetical protein
MSLIRKVQLSDGDGNYYESHLTQDNGYHLGTSIIQSVYADTNNSSTTNLTSANNYTFTGTSVSTLGVIGIQWSLKTDQNATVYIDESDDETNWDLSYSFDYIQSKGGRGETLQATKAFYRIRVVLIVEIDTTYFRLSGVLCPIATPLPSALSPDGRLQNESTLTGKENSDRHVWVSPTNTLNINTNVRLVGTNFDGDVKDPNFWTETVANGGSVVQDGEIKLLTTANINSSASYNSVRRARFVVGSANQFTGAFKFNDDNYTNNVRRCGSYDNENGYFFQLDGDMFSIGYRRGDNPSENDTIISSGSFNGNYGDTFFINNNVYYKLDIEWTPIGAFWYINNRLLHKTVGSHLTSKLTLPITFENYNYDIGASAIKFDCLGVVISREGRLETNPTYKYIAGATTTVLKVGAGDLHTIVNNDNAGSCIVYDNIVSNGTIIASIDLAKVLGTLTFNAPFSNGLTIVTVGATSKITVTYE